MKVLLFAASLRQDSCNKKLIQLVNQLIAPHHDTDLADFAEFDLPLYNGDQEDPEHFPPNMKKFIARMQQADALILSVPEYNFSTPGVLKNLIDWVSRAKPMPWKNQQILLLSASPSLVGGNRGLWHTRVPLEACGAFVYPEMFSLANAYQAFDMQGQFKDTAMQQRLNQTLTDFLATVRVP